MMEHDKYLMRQLYGKKCAMYNVGVMMPWMDYTPRTLDQILRGAARYDALLDRMHEEQSEDQTENYTIGL